ncbi:methyl-accepting chemotaxis protein [Halobellus sp. GM3]|uniref:methyl-accepting chemotaxis protein n=1 Tax=Halobellus sp. GM3 TaxID=3458410 RepID=UPI00403DDCEB
MDDRGVVVTDETRGLVDGDELIDALDIDDAEIEWRKSFLRLEDEDRERMEDLEPVFDDVAEEVVEEFYDHLTSDDNASDVLGRSSKGVERLKTDQASYLRSLTDGEYGREYFARRARVGKVHDMLDMGPKFYIGAYSIYYEGLLDAIGEEVKSLFDDGSEDVRSDRVDTGERSGVDGDADRSDDGGRGLLARILGGRRGTEDPDRRDSGSSGGDNAADSGGAESDVDAAVDDVIERATSLLKVLALDQQIAMDTYIHSYSEEARREAAHREELTREVERDLREPIDDVSAASSVVSERSAAIQEIADEQAADMDDVAAEISQMSATVEEIAATADGVEETSDEAASRARTGEEAADEAIDVMEEVADAAGEASADLEQLRSRIGEIDEVIEAIDDIAEQTNLLALNASIEAARAGEAGDGFAVVAQEVKQLAEQSRKRAADVEETVDRVQTDADDTIESLAETTEKLHEGIDRGEDAMDSLDEIVDAVERTTEGIAEVAVATDEQAVSAEEVTAMVETARERSENIADRVEDVTAASREQTREMEAIQAAADRLTALEDSDDGGPPIDRDSPPDGIESLSGMDGGPPAGIETGGGESVTDESATRGSVTNGSATNGAATNGEGDEFSFVGADGSASVSESDAGRDRS